MASFAAPAQFFAYDIEDRLLGGHETLQVVLIVHVIFYQKESP
jgi:hypothetical protein